MQVALTCRVAFISRSPCACSVLCSADRRENPARELTGKCLRSGFQVDKSPEGQFTQLMALPRTLQQRITRLVDPPGKNRDVEEVLLQVAQDPDCGLVVQQGETLPLYIPALQPRAMHGSLRTCLYKAFQCEQFRNALYETAIIQALNFKCCCVAAACSSSITVTELQLICWVFFQCVASFFIRD